MVWRKGWPINYRGGRRNSFKAGREIFIKVVAQALLAYTMSCFKLPKSWCDDLQAMVARFWCGQKNSERKIHWSNWSTLCKPKAEGGLGFRDLHRFNMAFLAKQGWRLLSQPHTSFYWVFKATCFPRTSFIHASRGNRPSFFWSSIMSAQQVLQKGSRWRLINAWNDPWLQHTPTQLPGPFIINKVSDLIDLVTRNWDVQFLQQDFTDFDSKQILGTKLNIILAL